MIRVTVSREFDVWLASFARAADISVEAKVEWQQAMDILYGRSQELVHVVSGNLKASGRTDVVTEGLNVVGSLVYGDETVDYALAEISRGGSHDYLTPAMTATQGMFEMAMIEVQKRVFI